MKEILWLYLSFGQMSILTKYFHCPIVSLKRGNIGIAGIFLAEKFNFKIKKIVPEINVCFDADSL